VGGLDRRIYAKSLILDPEGGSIGSTYEELKVVWEMGYLVMP
jgi:hypothetical protein